MPTDQLDLRGVLMGQVSVKPEEHPDERSLRLRLENRSALIEDCKGIAVFSVLLIGIAAIGDLAAYEGLIAEAASADTKRWCETILSALISGGVSFVVGRKIGK